MESVVFYYIEVIYNSLIVNWLGDVAGCLTVDCLRWDGVFFFVGKVVLLQRNFKHTMVMVKHYKKESNADLRLFTLEEDASGRVLRGKALYNGEEKEMTFVENAPRGPRSVEVGRTVHSRCVRRPDGLYTVTFGVDAGMRYLRANLVAEVGELVRVILADKELQTQKK